MGVLTDIAAVEAEHPFAQYVRTLGRGAGRSRALTRDEARTALAMVLRGEAEPYQVGAFLMLLRYRGEDPAEMAGLVEAARDTIDRRQLTIALDWPSYGAGRTRDAPWFLLAALALARAGYRVLMHGSNEFTRGTSVTAGLEALGLPVCAGLDEVERALQTVRFAYLPLEALCPGLDRLLRLRGLLGLRSPINTAARLLNPFGAAASVDGVFHPPYIALHLATAALLGQRRLIVVKGGGGEAERNPAKPMNVRLLIGADQGELTLPCLAAESGTAGLVATWLGEPGPGAVVARATVALGLLAMGVATEADADAKATEVWARRLAEPASFVRPSWGISAG